MRISVRLRGLERKQQEKQEEAFVSWSACSWFWLSQRLQGDDAALDRGSSGLGSVGYPELTQQAVDVGLDGGFGNVKFRGDLLVTSTAHDLLQDIELARSQLFCTDAFGKPLRNGRWNVRAPRMHGANSRDQVVGSHAFQQVSARACLQRTKDVFVAIVGGEHNEACLGRLHANALDGLDAREPWHAQVDQGDVGLALSELCNGLDAIRGLAYHFDSVHHIQKGHQALPHHVMVLNHENAYSFLSSHYSPDPSLASFSVVTCKRTVVPDPNALVNSSVPPMASARSRIPVSPK